MTRRGEVALTAASLATVGAAVLFGLWMLYAPEHVTSQACDAMVLLSLASTVLGVWLSTVLLNKSRPSR